MQQRAYAAGQGPGQAYLVTSPTNTGGPKLTFTLSWSEGLKEEDTWDETVNCRHEGDREGDEEGDDREGAGCGYNCLQEF